MNNNEKTHRPQSQSQASVMSIECNMLRRAGAMRSIIVDSQPINTDRLYGLKKQNQVVVEGIFGKALQDAQPEGSFQ